MPNLVDSMSRRLAAMYVTACANFHAHDAATARTLLDASLYGDTGRAPKAMACLDAALTMPSLLW